MGERCQNVWLAVAGLVINKDGDWLVVKKKYGGLEGKWSLPAGFVKYDETVDEAVVREVLEETGIHTEVKCLLGLRSGVLSSGVSDNMLIFLLEPLNDQPVAQEKELMAAAFMAPEDLKKDRDCSVLLIALMGEKNLKGQLLNDRMDPGKQFGYLSYKVFLSDSN
ncbi:NUDIX domain-containing protein [Bacillus testis]|uniref:NUDIX domain-containing protein n=1 Tax=Bacillus testis TaxID=1622072 RepID=UPI00067F58C5|nr:NUDIX hydrolase [Bacillus testis]